MSKKISLSELKNIIREIVKKVMKNTENSDSHKKNTSSKNSNNNKDFDELRSLVSQEARSLVSQEGRALVNQEARNLVSQEGRAIINQEADIAERSLTAAEEKKKEELVKALKSKYGKTPKTYAIATAKAKELAEDFFEDSDSEEYVTRDEYDSQVIAPRDGINASNKWLGIVFKNDEVDDNQYFDSETDARIWCDDCCRKGQEMDERMLAFSDKTRAPGRNKKNLPYHAPVSKTLDEMDEDMMEDLKYTDKYDDHSDLTKDQGKNLPDQLQKAIINKKSKKEIDEERMLPHPSIRVAGTRRKHTLPNHAPVTTFANGRNK